MKATKTVNMIDELVVDGQRWKLTKAIPARLKLPAMSQARSLGREPLGVFFGGMLSIVDPRTWTRITVQAIPLGPVQT